MFEVIMTTCPSQKVCRRIAEALVSARAAACVNVLGGVTSFYRWEGKVNEDREALLIAKTRSARRSEAQRIILENHPYELPEVVVLPIAAGYDRYLRWLAQETEAP